MSGPKKCNPAAQQPRPDATVRVGYEAGTGTATKLPPGHLLNNLAVDQVRQTVIIRGAKQTEPEAAVIVARDCIFRPCGHGRNRSKIAVFESGKPAET